MHTVVSHQLLKLCAVSQSTLLYTRKHDNLPGWIVVGIRTLAQRWVKVNVVYTRVVILVGCIDCIVVDLYCKMNFVKL